MSACFSFLIVSKERGKKGKLVKVKGTQRGHGKEKQGKEMNL